MDKHYTLHTRSGDYPGMRNACWHIYLAVSFIIIYGFFHTRFFAMLFCEIIELWCVLSFHSIHSLQTKIQSTSVSLPLPIPLSPSLPPPPLSPHLPMEAQSPASAQTAADWYRPSLDTELYAVPPSVSRAGGGFTTPSETHGRGQVTGQVTGHRSGQRSEVTCQVRGQVTGQVTCHMLGYRSHVRSPVGQRLQVTGQVTGQVAEHRGDLRLRYAKC